MCWKREQRDAAPSMIVLSCYDVIGLRCVNALVLCSTVAPAGFIRPCQPPLSDTVPSGLLWLHEIKHDGYLNPPERADAGLCSSAGCGDVFRSVFSEVATEPAAGSRSGTGADRQVRQPSFASTHARLARFSDHSFFSA